MNITEVNHGVRKNKPRKRLGRGIGSRQGKTAGRGHKGQGSRAGASQSPIFEGGQMPLVRRIPKRGFTNAWAIPVINLNIGVLNDTFEAGAVISLETLVEYKVLKRSQIGQNVCLKILGDGEITKPITVQAHKFSKSALEKLQAAGCTIEVLPGKAPVVKNKMKNKNK